MLTDEILELLNKIEDSEENDFMKKFTIDILLTDYYNNLPKEQNNTVKNILDKISKEKNKNLHKCNHQGCKNPSIGSHEISKFLLKKIANNDSKVYILKQNLRGNSLNYFFKKIHISEAIFSGYCNEHDTSLFSDIENNFQGINEHFINKQCLRTIKREIFENDAYINLAKKMIDEFNQYDVPKEHPDRENFEKKVSITINHREQLNLLYQEIFLFIEKKDYKIKSKIIKNKNRNFYFSTMLNLTEDSDFDKVFIFIHIIEGTTIISYTDNETSLSLVNDLIKNNKILLEIIHENYHKLILSEYFINHLTYSQKKLLLRNELDRNIGFFEYLTLKELFI